VSTPEYPAKMAGAVPFLIPSEYVPAVRVRVRVLARCAHPPRVPPEYPVSTYRLTCCRRTRACVRAAPVRPLPLKRY
jgi:hypothetical protein